MMEDPLQPWRQQDLDLTGLVEAAATLLSRCAAPADERVSARPDERTVRYYQTLGLVDKPSRYEGRVARYHLRHLLQVVGIKLLQGHGLGLSQIQGSLAGATDAELEAALLRQLGVSQVFRPPLPPHPRPARRLMAVELTPGVQLLLDPDLVPDPELLIQRLSSALSGGTP